MHASPRAWHDGARVGSVWVYDHDPARASVALEVLEGDPLSIRRLRRKVVQPALWGVGDLADVDSVGVHREDSTLGLIRIEVAAKDDLTVPGSITARARVLFVIAFATGEHRKSHGHHH